ncbi:unnamed protein product, partial [Brassica oleracea var. botrytis]
WIWQFVLHANSRPALVHLGMGMHAYTLIAPYFPSTEPEKFDQPWQREYAVNALCYEAEARIQDHIHGVLPKTLANISQLDTLDLRNNSLSGFVPPDSIFVYVFVEVVKGLKKLNERLHFENNTGLCGLDFPCLRACSAFDDANIEVKQPQGETNTDKSTLHNMSDSAYLKQHCNKVALISQVALISSMA